MDSISPDHAMLAGLNPAQTEAVRHHEGPLLVLAGAGSGKTRVLTSRIARLITVHGVDPRAILSVTFTNKAAGEMRARIGRLLGGDPAGMWMGTFHSIGARMLRMNPDAAGLSKTFTIYDQDDSLSLIKRLMTRHRVPAKEIAPRAVQGAISSAKNAMVPPSEYEVLASTQLARAVAPIYRDFGEALRTANAVDFDDLLLLPVHMLASQPHVLAHYQRRFQYILVDEYQDTNRAQYELVRLLGSASTNVCVVGDDDQSIYGWRGADVRNITAFTRDFAGAAVVRLEDNYRSTAPILELANVVIRENPGRMGKTLRPTRAGGQKVVSVRALDERDEAEWIIEEVERLRSGAGGRIALRDVSLLYRTNSQSRALEETLRRQSIPYRLIGAVRFYERREIRDLMSYLRLVANPADDEAFLRAIAVPKRGLGDTTLDRLAEAARQLQIPLLAAAVNPDATSFLRAGQRESLGAFVDMMAELSVRAETESPDVILQDVIDATGYLSYLREEGPESAERLENVRELVEGAGESEAPEDPDQPLRPIDVFLQSVALVADSDALDPNADAVTLMTIHNAKGLEFPVVFITGLEDGLFPLARAFEDPPLLAEERRLFYVGITRAEQHLYLTHAEERRRNGEFTLSRRSSFLDSIPAGMLEERSTVRVRSAGRAAVRGQEGSAGDYRSWNRGGNRPADEAVLHPFRHQALRGGAPVQSIAEEEISQDVPTYLPGARVRHRRFGTGTIAEVSGSGRDGKVKIDFDDEEIGRKTLVIAQANLERAED